MTLFVLDTDLWTLFTQGHAAVARHLQSHDPDELAVSVVTVEEVLTGWYTRIRQAKTDEQVAHAYSKLLGAMEPLKSIRTLPFSLPAVQRATALRKKFRRVGKMDLAIAAIVLEHGATLATRNAADFQQIPGLALADWTQP